MERGRWYPTNTTLPNGDILVVAGADENGGHVATPEVWNGSGWRHLTSANLTLPYYPTMFVAPNGKVFMAGPDQTSRYLDATGTGQWMTVAQRNVPSRDYGSAVMYSPGKILYAGGGDPPTASAEVIDLNQSSPSWRSVPGMQYRRRQMMATVLADGKVLVTHGTSGTGFNDLGSVVHYAELWNPVTESWTTMAREASIRAYHSTAVLLPDGRVFSSGSGEGGGVGVGNSQFSAQVFSPPYLFNRDGSLATRPTIGSAPSRLGYGESFTVGTPNAGSVTRGNLIRLSSSTHTFNMSQAIYPLTFAATGSSTLSASAPASGRLAPPGPLHAVPGERGRRALDGQDGDGRALGHYPWRRCWMANRRGRPLCLPWSRQERWERRTARGSTGSPAPSCRAPLAGCRAGHGRGGAPPSRC